MANNPLEGMTNEFFEQILCMPGYANSSTTPSDPSDDSTGGLLLQMGPRATFSDSIFPLGLSLEQRNSGFIQPDNASGSNSNRFSDDIHRNSTTTIVTTRENAPHVHQPHRATWINPVSRGGMERDAGEPGSLFPAFGNTPASARPAAIQSGQGMVSRQTFHGQPTSSATMAQLPAARPRARARRGQATDPHSIAERLRRERIAEKIKQLQELVPNCNKTDRAAMLDEIMDYVKFLRLQVNVLSMSRLGGTGSVAQLASGVPCPTVEGDENGGNQEPQVWDKWLGDGTEQHVAKLMREDVGAAMQFLQSKSLCLLPISLAMAIYSTHPPEDAPDGTIKSEPNTHTS